jgi:hypothetical protein
MKTYANSDARQHIVHEDVIGMVLADQIANEDTFSMASAPAPRPFLLLSLSFLAYCIGLPGDRILKRVIGLGSLRCRIFYKMGRQSHRSVRKSALDLASTSRENGRNRSACGVATSWIRKSRGGRGRLGDGSCHGIRGRGRLEKDWRRLGRNAWTRRRVRALRIGTRNEERRGGARPSGRLVDDEGGPGRRRFL